MSESPEDKEARIIAQATAHSRNISAGQAAAAFATTQDVAERVAKELDMHLARTPHFGDVLMPRHTQHRPFYANAPHSKRGKRRK